MSHVIVVLLIGMVILVHELGHFIAAKRAGIGIAVFSLGFGPRLIGRKWRETEYRLSLIPIGGFVLPEIGDEREFFAIPVNKRIAMALDGGKVFLYLLEKIHPPLRRLRLPLAVAGWIFIIGLTVHVTVFDVGRLLGGKAGL